MARRAAVVSSCIVVVAGVLAACGSFSGSDTPSGGDTPEGGGGYIVESGSPDGSAGLLDPCIGKPDATEIAGLYIVGGQAPSDGPDTTVNEILRAPIHCDHSLGAFNPLATKLPAGIALGQTALLDDGILVVGGENNRNKVQYARFAGADLGPFASFPAPTSSYRAIGAARSDLLLVASDETPSTTVTLWQVLPTGPTPFGKPTAAPSALPRGAAAFVKNTVYVVASPAFLSADVQADGTMSAWTQLTREASDFDLSVASDDAHLYVVGGAANPSDLWVYTVGTTTSGDAGPKPAGGKYKLPLPAALSMVVVYRDTLYIVGSDYPPYGATMIVPLVGDGIGTITMGPSLPAPRFGSGIVVRPL